MKQYTNQSTFHLMHSKTSMNIIISGRITEVRISGFLLKQVQWLKFDRLLHSPLFPSFLFPLFSSCFPLHLSPPPSFIFQKPYACPNPGCTKRYTDPSSRRKHMKNCQVNKKVLNTDNTDNTIVCLFLICLFVCL